MVFDEFGFELAHQTFSGNTQDSTTLAFLVNTLKKLTDSDQEFGRRPSPLSSSMRASRPKTTCADCVKKALVTSSMPVGNSERSTPIIFATTAALRQCPVARKTAEREPQFWLKPSIHTFTEEASDDPSEASDSENAPETITERLVLCKSDTRGDKERAMISKAEEKLLERLQKLATRIAKGQIKKVSKIHEAIGRLRSNNSRVVRFYDIDFQAAKKPAKGEPSGVLHYTRKDQLFADSQLVMGCYVLRTDQQDLPAEQLWQLYITLVLAEEGFRLLKTDLGLRPNFHQIEDRVDGHIFITVLAYTY